MSLVADPLEELERRGSSGRGRSTRRPRDEHLLLALRERDDGDPGKIELLQSRECGSELSLASVDDDEVRRLREALVDVALLDVARSGGRSASRIAPTSSWPARPRIANVR